MKEIYSVIRRNFTVLIIAQGIYKIFAFLTYVLIARFLGVIGFGQISFALSFVGLFSVAVDFGLSELLIRDVAGNIGQLGEKYISNIISLKFALAIISYFLIVVIDFILLKDRLISTLILVLGLCMVLDSFTLFFRSIFRLFERMEFEAFSLISEAILKLGFVFIMLKYVGASAIEVGLALLIVSSVVFILTKVISIIKFVRPKFSLDYIFIINLIKKTLPFSFLTFFGVINFKITTVIAAHLLDYIQVGWYSAAIRLIEPILILPVTMAVAIFPSISRIYKDSGLEVFSLYKSYLRVLFYCGIVIVVVLNIFAHRVVPFVFGKEYLNAIAVFRVLSLSLVPFFLKFFLERFLLVIERADIMILSYLFGTVLAIVLGGILVKRMGYVGAGIALGLSEFFIVGYNLLGLIRIKTRCLKARI